MRRRVPPLCGLGLVAAMILLLFLCMLCLELRWIVPNPVEQYRFSLTPSPTPGYEPMTGLAYVTTRGVGAQVKLLLGPTPGRGGWGAFLRHGTQVEILESVWYYSPGRYGSTTCYVYHIRDPKGDAEGWLEEDRLTKDLAEIPAARCYPGTPYVPPTLSPPLAGRVFVTTLGTQNDSVDFWGGPQLEAGGDNYLFSKPHGTPAEIVEVVTSLLDPDGRVCYRYLVRTDDGLSGWVHGRWLTQDLGQPPPESCFERMIPTPTPRPR